MPAASDESELIRASLDNDKAEDIVVIDLRGKASFADTMIIASGNSDRHVKAMANHLIEKLKAAGRQRVPAEGMEHGEWVLLDSGDTVVHLFKPETRGFYNLEKLWADEPKARAVRVA